MLPWLGRCQRLLQSLTMLLLSGIALSLRIVLVLWCRLISSHVFLSPNFIGCHAGVPANKIVQKSLHFGGVQRGLIGGRWCSCRGLMLLQSFLLLRNTRSVSTQPIQRVCVSNYIYMLVPYLDSPNLRRKRRSSFNWVQFQRRQKAWCQRWFAQQRVTETSIVHMQVV